MLEPTTLERFSWQGFYGIGDGAVGSDVLCTQLEGLLTDADRRRELGQFGRRTVLERYSLAAAARRLLGIYERAASAHPPAWQLAPEAARLAGRAAANELRLHLPSDKRARREHDRAQLAAAAGR